MLRIKKTWLAMITIGFSGIANAGMYEAVATTEAACGADSVTVGCPRLGWNLGIEGLYVRTNDFEQATAVFDVDGPGVTTFQKIVPDWALGFRLEASYHWSTANDINLNWTHFSKITDAVITDPGAGLAGYFVGFGYDEIDTSLDNSADIINLEVGQGVSFGEHVLARFHGGLQFARLTQDVTQTGTDTIDDITEIDTNNSQYSGMGPRAGADLQYGFGNGFSVVCDAAATLLYGKRSLDVARTFSDINGSVATSSNTSENVVVPGADAKLGLKFSYPLSIGDFSIEGGYRIANYWQAVDLAHPSAALVGGLGVNHIAFGDEDENFAYQGVYLGLKWLENA